MDKQTFDIIKRYSNLVNDLYFKLESIVGMDKAEELVDEITGVQDEILEIGIHSNGKETINKETYLTKKYEDLDSYIKINVIYEYENGYVLGETTSGLLSLIPKEKLAEY